MGGRVPRTQRPRVRPGEGWAPPGRTLTNTHHATTTHNHTIPDRLPPGSTRTAPSAVHQDGGVKCATGASSKIQRKRQHHHRHLEHKDSKSCREIQELTHEMDRYRWNILGLCEMRWKNFGETTTVEGHTVFCSNRSMALDFLFTRTS